MAPLLLGDELQVEVVLEPPFGVEGVEHLRRDRVRREPGRDCRRRCQGGHGEGHLQGGVGLLLGHLERGQQVAAAHIF